MDIVNENATFQHDDIFHRVDFAKKAMALIESHPAGRGACVVSIDAPWGMGKSTFLRMWKNELDSYNQEETACQEPLFTRSTNSCIYYNAWENDYYENAFIPLLFTISGSLIIEKDEKEEREKKKRDLLRKVTSAGAGILGFMACASTTKNPELATGIGALTTTAVDSFMQMFDNSDLDVIGQQYEKEIALRQEFSKAVAELAETAGRLFIFVDELDRCKPLFAVQTLECIKHFFNIPNVVFVFATDISQLVHSVAGIYGEGMNAGGYLSKFFDYQLHLPVPEISDLLQYAYPRIAVGSGFYDIANEIREAFIVTPREMPIIINQAYALWNSLNLSVYVRDISYEFSYFVCIFALKFKWPEQYTKLFHGTLEWRNRIDEKKFMTVYNFFTYTEKWVRKSSIELNKELNKVDSELMKKSSDQNAVMTYDDEEMEWLYLLNNTCRNQHFGARTIGEVLHTIFEVF